MATSAIFVVLACSLSLAWSASTTSANPANTDLIWGDCTVFNVTDANPNLSCGYYEVPMDYFNPTAGKARLAVMKYRATVSNKKGTLFVNPGGPGGSGVDFVSLLGDLISKEFQGYYDIVSWDPRGVGSYTFPGDVICFSTPAEQFAFWDNTVVRSINETISTNFTDPNELEEFFSRVPETIAKLDEFGKRCLASKSGPYLQYMGTTSTIRDLVSLANKIVGPGQPIDYYGYSYGTVIGFHFFSLFPHRVGHFILDGVVDPSKWGRYDFDYDSVIHSEEAFTTFANACAQAGAAKCLPVHMVGKKNATGSDVRTLITSTIDLALKLQRVGYTKLPSQAGELKSSLFALLYFPAYWPIIANQHMYPKLVATLTAGRDHGFTDQYILPENPVELLPEMLSLSYSLKAIVGADGAASNGVPLKKVFQDLVATTRDRTPTFGAKWFPLTAPKWPVRSVEDLPIFTRKTLSNRVLVIGNTIDPITPLESAQYVSQLLGSGNAVLVEHQAVGHTTFAQYSNCTNNIVTNFLLNSQVGHKFYHTWHFRGKVLLQLPEQDTKCAPNSNDFFPDTPTNVSFILPWLSASYPTYKHASMN